MSQEQIKEAIEKIEKLLINHRQSHISWLDYFKKYPEKEKEHMDSVGGIQDQNSAIKDYDEALQTLALLRPLAEEPKCKRYNDCNNSDNCNGEGMIDRPVWDTSAPNDGKDIPCPDYQVEEPEGEFTKSLQEILEHLRFWKDHPHAGLPSYITEAEKGLTKACDIINRQAAELKAKDKLLFAYESVRAPLRGVLGKQDG